MPWETTFRQIPILIISQNNREISENNHGISKNTYEIGKQLKLVSVLTNSIC